MSTVLSIIVTHNGLTNNWIDTCLNSLSKSEYYTDILVIDNASTDHTKLYIQQHFPHVQLVCSDKNLGFGRANNIGLEACLNKDYHFAFLLNQDASVQSDTLSKLIKIAKKNPVYGVLSPIHLNADGSALDNNFSSYLEKANRKSLTLGKASEQPENVYDCDFVNAAAWLMSRKCIEQVGGFSPVFFHYGEDNNYCDRVKWHNLKICIVDHTNIYHDRKTTHQAQKARWKRTFESIKVAYANPFEKKGNLYFIGHLMKYGFKNPGFLRYILNTLITFPYRFFFKCKEISMESGAFLKFATK